AAIAANLEEAGDQISSNLLDLAKRMHAEGLQFSRKGWLDITDFHDRVISNAQLALNVLMSGDPEIARQLVSEKDRIRQLEKSLQVRHLERLRKGKPSSIETSNLHQEIVRSLKQVNSAFCFIGYPIVERTGALLKSRLSSKS
ncbi:MAG: Na/Pi cotransporter family protein, partial [Paracoccaceae bacterium]|nr:Na/Pi cotransporter family protein [Paracoccaceae bacterium]